MSKSATRKIWMRVLNKDDAVELRALLTSRYAQGAEWDFRVFGGKIVVYILLTPWNAETHKPDLSMRYMAKRWRVVPEPGGPFQLEYMRQTEQWWPIFEVVGDLKKMAECISAEAIGWGSFASIRR